MKILSIWGHKLRPWGYEVRINLLDNFGQTHCEVVCFPVDEKDEKPDEKTIDLAVADLVKRVEARLTAQAELEAAAPRVKAEMVEADYLSAVSAGVLDAAAAKAKIEAIIASKAAVK